MTSDDLGVDDEARGDVVWDVVSASTNISR